MRTIFKHVLITPRNFRRISAGIVPPDQRAAIRAGIYITHYTFTNRQRQTGFVIISHAAQRAGICVAGGPSAWGRWSAEDGRIITDAGRVYSREGEQLYAAVAEHRA
jgi:hypothetical protein